VIPTTCFARAEKQQLRRRVDDDLGQITTARKMYSHTSGFGLRYVVSLS
jgi:hypothetical protein